MSAVEILRQVIRENTPRSIWTDAPLESFRRVENTNRGEIGEEFLRRYLARENIPMGRKTGRTSREDMQIAGEIFEVKTASEGANGTFQFNHIRLDRRYKYLLCLGIRPVAVVFGVWSKGDVAEESAGSLVRMAEGQSVTFKLTKKVGDLNGIAGLPEWIRATLMTPPAARG